MSLVKYNVGYSIYVGLLLVYLSLPFKCLLQKNNSTTCSFTSKVSIRLCDSLLTFHSKLTFRPESTSPVLYQKPQKLCKIYTSTFCSLLQASLHKNKLKNDSQKRTCTDLHVNIRLEVTVLFVLKVGDIIWTCQ